MQILLEESGKSRASAGIAVGITGVEVWLVSHERVNEEESL